MTMQDAFDSFIFSRRLSALSPKTISDYQDVIRPFVAFIGPEKPLEALSRENIQEYISKLLRRPLSKASKASYIRQVKIFLRWIEEEYELSLGAKKLKVPKSPRREVRIYTPDEVDMIFQAIQAESPWITARNRAIVALMYDSGLRQSEVCNILRMRISFSDARLIVRGKGDKERTVPMGKLTIQYIQEYLSLRPFSHERLFVNRRGGPLSGNAVKLMVSKLADCLPFELSSHKLRHNFATNYCVDHLEQDGHVDIYKLMYIMGHEDIKTTQIYLHFAYEILACRGNISHLDRVRLPASGET